MVHADSLTLHRIHMHASIFLITLRLRLSSYILHYTVSVKFLRLRLRFGGVAFVCLGLSVWSCLLALVCVLRLSRSTCATRPLVSDSDWAFWSSVHTFVVHLDLCTVYWFLHHHDLSIVFIRHSHPHFYLSTFASTLRSSTFAFEHPSRPHTLFTTHCSVYRPFLSLPTTYWYSALSNGSLIDCRNFPSLTGSAASVRVSRGASEVLRSPSILQITESALWRLSGPASVPVRDDEGVDECGIVNVRLNRIQTDSADREEQETETGLSPLT